MKYAAKTKNEIYIYQTFQSVLKAGLYYLFSFPFHIVLMMLLVRQWNKKFRQTRLPKIVVVNALDTRENFHSHQLNHI